jgi:hypothetical protein
MKMTTFRRCFLNLVISVVGGISLLCTPVNAQVDPFGATIENVRSSIVAILQKLENTASNTAFRLRSEMHFLLSEVEHMAKTTTAQVSDVVAKERATTVLAIESTIKLANAELAKTVRIADDTVVKISDSISRIPFSDKRPRVFSLLPLYAVSGGSSAQKVSFQGAFLKWGVPTLKFGRIACTAGTHLDNKIDFLCARDIFVANNGITHVVGQLQVHEPRGFVDQLREFFVKPTPLKSYNVAISILPTSLGKVSIDISTPIKRRITQPRSDGFSHQNDHCQDRTNHDAHFSVTAGAGWKIDIPSIMITGGGSGGNGGAVNRRIDGFSVPFWVTNNGFCGPREPLTGRRIGYDGRGSYHGSASWVEWREVEDVTRATEPPKSIYWGRDVTFPLSNPASSAIVKVTQIDGREIAIVPGQTSDWFVAQIDAARGTLIVKPRTLEDAMK